MKVSICVYIQQNKSNKKQYLMMIREQLMVFQGWNNLFSCFTSQENSAIWKLIQKIRQEADIDKVHI